MPWLRTREGNEQCEFLEHMKGSHKHAVLGRLWGGGGVD